MFEGVSVALVTPFRKGAVDLDSLRALVARLLQAGVDGFVPCGSTGEAATLTRDERRSVIKTVVDETNGRAFVVPGTGTNDTRVSVEFSLDAKELGVTGVMAVTPYYNKPSPNGLVAHFEAIARATGLPVLAYNVPSRTGYNMPAPIAARLAAIPGVVALKEASGSVDQAIDIRAAAPNLTLLSGEDSLTLPLLSIGARGIVSVAGHIVGRDLKAMLLAFEAGDVAEARKRHEEVMPLCRAVFWESNPAPVKYAMSRLGWLESELRAPLAPVTPETASRIDEVLRTLRLL